MISHIIGTLSDKQVFGLVCHNYINLLYILRRVICKNLLFNCKTFILNMNRDLYSCLINITFYLYYLQTINRSIRKIKFKNLYFICHLENVSETLCSLLFMLFLLPDNQVLTKMVNVNDFSFNSLWNFIQNLKNMLIRNRSLILVVIYLSFYVLVEQIQFKLTKNWKLVYRLMIIKEDNDNSSFVSKSYGSETNLSDLSSSEFNDDKFYKAYYEWLAGVIDTVGILKFNNGNIKYKSRNAVLDLVLVRPYYRVLTAVWLEYGGSIKQISNVDKKDFVDEYKAWRNKGERGDFWLKYERNPSTGHKSGDKEDLSLENDFPFQTWRYRLSKYEKIEIIIQNTYPLLRRKYIKNILSEQKIIKLSNLSKLNKSTINWDSQWFAGVFDACGSITADEYSITILLNDVCIDLLEEIRRNFGSIGSIIRIYKYSKDGVNEIRGSWFIYKFSEIIEFASIILYKYKLITGKDHRLKLVENYCNLWRERKSYVEKGMTNKLESCDIKMQELIAELNKYTYL